MLLLTIETENHISQASSPLNQKYLIQENVLLHKGQINK